MTLSFVGVFRLLRKRGSIAQSDESRRDIHESAEHNHDKNLRQEPGGTCNEPLRPLTGRRRKRGDCEVTEGGGGRHAMQLRIDAARREITASVIMLLSILLLI